MKRIRSIVLAASLALACAAALGQQFISVALLNAATTTGAGPLHAPRCDTQTFQAYGATTAGAGASTSVVQVSNVESPTTNDWITLGTITLVLATTSSTDGFVSLAPWRFIRVNQSALSGTGATVTVLMSCKQ